MQSQMESSWYKCEDAFKIQSLRLHSEVIWATGDHRFFFFLTVYAHVYPKWITVMYAVMFPADVCEDTVWFKLSTCLTCQHLAAVWTHCFRWLHQTCNIMRGTVNYNQYRKLLWRQWRKWPDSLKKIVSCGIRKHVLTMCNIFYNKLWTIWAFF